MAVLMLNDAYISLAAVDYSPYAKSVTFSFSAEMLEDTAMGDTTHSKKPGLQNWTLDAEFYSDFSDGGIDEILQALMGTEVAIILRPVESVVIGDANPEYRMTGLLVSWDPIGGGVGEMSMAKAHFVPGSTGVVTRAVA